MDDYFSGEIQGRRVGTFAAKTDWAGIGFLGSNITTVVVGLLMDDMKKAFRMPFGLAFAPVSALCFLQGVPAKDMPSNRSKSYLDGFSKGYKRSRRIREISYCFSGCFLSYVCAALVMVGMGDVVP